MVMDLELYFCDDLYPILSCDLLIPLYVERLQLSRKHKIKGLVDVFRIG